MKPHNTPEGETRQPEGSAPAPPPSTRMILVMAGVAASAGLLIVLAFQITLPVITANKAKALREAVFQVVPGAKSLQTFGVTDAGEVVFLEEGKTARGEKGTKKLKAFIWKIYGGYNEEGALLGVALEAAGQGYQDTIGILYGYDPAKEKVIGMAVLASKETPGLGDKIAKDPVFMENFKALEAKLKADGSGLLEAIKVVKKGTKKNPWEIDAITGATISSDAVGKIFNQSLPARLPVVQKNLANFKK